MVAPSFQTYKMITPEPFAKNGKFYVTVEHPNTHNQRDVRWYNTSEYQKQYGKSGNTSTLSQELAASLKKARGFTDGPITLIRNTKSADETWLCNSKARYAVDTGWYFISSEPVPAGAPAHFRYMALSWEEFTSDGVHKKPNEDVIATIRAKEKRQEYVQ